MWRGDVPEMRRYACEYDDRAVREPVGKSPIVRLIRMLRLERAYDELSLIECKYGHSRYDVER